MEFRSHGVIGGEGHSQNSHVASGRCSMAITSQGWTLPCTIGAQELCSMGIISAAPVCLCVPRGTLFHQHYLSCLCVFVSIVKAWVMRHDVRVVWDCMRAVCCVCALQAGAQGAASPSKPEHPRAARQAKPRQQVSF